MAAELFPRPMYKVGYTDVSIASVILIGVYGVLYKYGVRVLVQD